MKLYLITFLLLCSNVLQAKEWASLKCYKKNTKQDTLSASDWLKKDRRRNTLVWQNANRYNLENNLPQEYTTIKQRRDFYAWYSSETSKKGHHVLWPVMAHFINKKLRLIKAFPFSIVISKDIKQYATNGSEDVFNECFIKLNTLLKTNRPLTTIEAQNWDENILHIEQFQWIEAIYKTMPEKSLKTIERMAKRKFLYALVVPKAIKFKGDITSAEVRYKYALNTLKPYCKAEYALD